MRITWNAALRYFHLATTEMSYLMGVTLDGRLLHLYWGAALTCPGSADEVARAGLDAYAMAQTKDSRRDRSCYEIPTLLPGDYSEPVLACVHPDGVRSLRLRCTGHRIEGDRLTVELADEVYPLRVEAVYRGWADLPLLSRSLTVYNDAGEDTILDVIKSAAWHVPQGHTWRLTHFAGDSLSEYMRQEVILSQARTVLQNNRLTQGGHQQVPFFALDRDGRTTETEGELYFGVLHWSGDFCITAEVQSGRRVSVTGGINDRTANWRLEPGQRFETPLFTAGFVRNGFERMSEVLYDWQYDHLLPRGLMTDKAHGVRPILYNSWYPYSFHITEENCLGLVDRCADLGVELFVVDDGWMPGREGPSKGLGDWTADPVRFPRGLSAIAERCRENGLLFGLWVEPEMVNPDSDLYRAHPDWVIHDPSRGPSLQRSQLILNLGRDDVRDWIIETLDRIVETYKPDYLKWDMNRYVTENGWPDAPPEDKKSLPIRYIRNLTAVWDHLNRTYPDLLLENCASGGGRADFGMVPYADRINRSDNSDPVEVMLIHEGFTTLFPPKTAGGAGNIALERTAAQGRVTPLDFRILWGMTGSLSIGINLLTATEAEMDQLRAAIGTFKRLRPDLQDAYVYRIASAREHPYALFQYVRRDRRAFSLFAFAHGMRSRDLPLPRFRMRGLLPEVLYVSDDGREMTGEALMEFGLSVSLLGDCAGEMSVWHASDRPVLPA